MLLTGRAAISPTLSAGEYDRANAGDRCYFLGGGGSPLMSKAPGLHS
jgi:hypothetical protein